MIDTLAGAAMLWAMERERERQKLDARLPTADEQQETFMVIARRRFAEPFVPAHDRATPPGKEG